MKPYTLTNRGGESISPMTSTRTVFDDNGVDLETRLANQKQAADNTLKEYAKKTEVTGALAGKQDTLTPTTDLQITADNIIGLTEKAKMRVFDDQWTAAGGTVIVSGKTYGLNELTLTYEEAVYHLIRSGSANYEGNTFGMFCGDKRLRTVFPIKKSRLFNTDSSSMFSGCNNLEIVRIENYCAPARMNTMFSGCTTLREIQGQLQAVYADWRYCTHMFDGCANLEEVRIEIKGDISFADSPKLSLASLSFTVEQGDRYSTATTKTLTLHPTAYARVTDELFALAAEKQITIAST